MSHDNEGPCTCGTCNGAVAHMQRAESRQRKGDGRKTVSEMKPKELARVMADGWWPFERAEVRAGTTVQPPPGVYAVWINNRYSVQVSDRDTEWGRVVHLWIRRHDGAPVCPWADMQRIKDDLFGPERLGVQVFPPRSELVDQANIYHLWILPEGFRLPFSLKAGI